MTNGEGSEGGPPSSLFMLPDMPGFEASAWLATLIQMAEGAVVGRTLEGIVVTWNPAAQRLFGYRAEEILGRSADLLAGPERPDEMVELLKLIREGQNVVGYETLQRRKDGTLVPVSLNMSPVRNAAGELIGALNIARDISERMDAEERFRLLADDLAHRTKNLLSLVLGIVRRTQRDDVEEYREAIEGRIRALDVANFLLSADNWRYARLDTLIRHMVDAFQEGGANFTVRGLPVRVTPEAAQALAMVIHELGTNATKYGALSGEGGNVVIECDRRDGGIRLTWREEGGPPVRPPSREGLGMRVIRLGVERQCGGTLDMDWRPEGLRCAIDLPEDQILG